MPNTSIYDTTPGSAVTGALQEILARRRVEARQAMLDKIAADERERDEAYRQSQMKLQQDQFGLAKTQEARVAAGDEISRNLQQEQLNQARLEPFARGADLSTVTDPAIKELMLKRGVDTAQPFGPTEEGGTPEPRQFYKGSPTYQKEQSDRDALVQFRNSINEVENPELAQWADAQIAGISNVPSELLGEAPKTYVFDVEEGRLRESPLHLGRNARVLTQTRPPRLPDAKPWQLVGPNGEELNITGTGDLNTFFAQGYRLRRTSDDRASTVFSSPLMQQYNDIATKQITANARNQAYRGIEDQMIATMQGVTPQAINITSSILNDVRVAAQAGDDVGTVDEVVSAAVEALDNALKGSASEQEKTKVGEAVRFLIGRYLAQ